MVGARKSKNCSFEQKNIKKIKKENIMTEEEYGGGIRSTG